MSAALDHFNSQFGLPQGVVGRLAGAIMAIENKRANRLVVDLLELGPADRVLEVGCGPGVALKHAAGQAALAVGVDPSEVMVAQARRRCARERAAARAAVHLASAESLPFADGSFTCAFAVHTTHHWPCVRAGLNELYRVLQPERRVALAGRVARPGRDPHAHGASESDLEAFEKLLKEVGFAEVTCSRHDLGRETLAVFVAAR